MKKRKPTEIEKEFIRTNSKLINYNQIIYELILDKELLDIVNLHMLDWDYISKYILDYPELLKDNLIFNYFNFIEWDVLFNFNARKKLGNKFFKDFLKYAIEKIEENENNRSCFNADFFIYPTIFFIYDFKLDMKSFHMVRKIWGKEKESMVWSGLSSYLDVNKHRSIIKKYRNEIHWDRIILDNITVIDHKFFVRYRENILKCSPYILNEIFINSSDKNLIKELITVVEEPVYKINSHIYFRNDKELLALAKMIEL
ncbi:hypothetical protein Bp8pS_183 [Bacillus phage vB_BpuM-BpSp]|nr:hypothetical protein Bp8pS_183 [Bacillus phage vB_BpuM-BpSp]